MSAALEYRGRRIDRDFVLRCERSRRLRLQLALKRTLDVLLSATLLLALSPVLFGTAVAVALESRGGIFFSGARYGKDGIAFACHKFRTMYANGDEILRAFGRSNEGDAGRLLVFDDDPRITRLGRFLRKTSVDELPQLWNVLCGEMSLIGPRPLSIEMLDRYADLRFARAVVRPGITGLWQVRNRAKNVSALDTIADDMEYVRRFSLLLDACIALATIPRLLEPSGD